LAQVAIALAALLYAPYEWRSRPHYRGDCTGAFWGMAWPPPTLQACYAINFPAVAAAYSVTPRWATTCVFHRPDQLVWLTVQDVIFLALVWILWFGVAAVFPLSWKSPTSGTRAFTVIGLLVGCFVSLGIAHFAAYYPTLTYNGPPARHMRPFGLFWAGLLFSYFAGKLAIACRRRLNTQF